MSKNKESIIPRDYASWLTSLKSRISSARQRATIAVNQELVRLYHHIGTEILERQSRQGWGAKVIDRLAADLRAAFPEMKGFSSAPYCVHQGVASDPLQTKGNGSCDKPAT